MSDESVQALFRPFTVGAMSLPNRIVMAPMTRRFSPGGVPGADVAAYYARRAAGGTGLIITEGTFIDHPAAGWAERVPRFHGEEALAGWQRVAEEVHSAGGRIVPQLWHVGANPGMPPAAGAFAISPSGLGLDGRPLADGRPMTQAAMDEVIASYVRAASEAERRGFDGVEIHAAHGYLIDAFLWSTTNRRTDAYGGSVQARTRFAREIVAAVRDAVSASFPIFFRFSQWKTDHYEARLAHTPQELEKLLIPLAEAGVDVFHASTQFHSKPAFDGSDLTLAGWVKKLISRPTLAVGAVGLNLEFMKALAGEEAHAATLDRLLEQLEREEFDLIAVGRSLLADPLWSQKVRAGHTDDVTPFSRTLLGTLH